LQTKVGGIGSDFPNKIGVNESDMVWRLYSSMSSSSLTASIPASTTAPVTLMPVDTTAPVIEIAAPAVALATAQPWSTGNAKKVTASKAN